MKRNGQPLQNLPQLHEGTFSRPSPLGEGYPNRKVAVGVAEVEIHCRTIRRLRTFSNVKHVRASTGAGHNHGGSTDPYFQGFGKLSHGLPARLNRQREVVENVAVGTIPRGSGIVAAAGAPTGTAGSWTPNSAPHWRHANNPFGSSFWLQQRITRFSWRKRWDCAGRPADKKALRRDKPAQRDSRGYHLGSRRPCISRGALAGLPPNQRARPPET